MPQLTPHARESFSPRRAAPKAAAKGVGGMRKSELASACTEVLEACSCGDAEALRTALESHITLLPDIVNARDDSGWTALHVAVGWCAVECVSLLLKRGANPDLTNNQGQSVRELAVQLGYDSLAVQIVPVQGAAEAARHDAQKAQLRLEIDTITQGLPRSITITCCPMRANIRRPN